MCSRYTYNKDEAKLKLRDQILVFGFVPRSDIRPTDLGPVIIPEHDGFACQQMSWGCRVHLALAADALALLLSPKSTCESEQ